VQVSHEFTNYRLAQGLYKAGHEIAVHTITHGRNIDWAKEVEQQRQILHTFGQIPSNQVSRTYGWRDGGMVTAAQPPLCGLLQMLGFRAPFLDVGRTSVAAALAYRRVVPGSALPHVLSGGDPMFTALSRNGFTHDSSILSAVPFQGPAMFPYTLEFPLTQVARVGAR
jgi:hypothetical protein